VAGGEGARSGGVLYEGETLQVVAASELVVPASVAVVHQAPTASDEREDTCTLYILLRGLAEAVVQRPGLWMVKVGEGVPANALVTSVSLRLEEEMVEAVLDLDYVGINSGSLEVE